MAISCTGCGRQYDVTLFQFGRTIHCTCGRRVGLEHRLEIADSPEDPRFFADVMLGRLARWLRTLGYDTAHEVSIADADLVRRAFLEGRRILTRDRKLFDEWRIDGGLLVRAEGPLAQLAEVAEAFHLTEPERLFTRCRVCNGVLERLDPHRVPGRVPARITNRARDFVECADCSRVYWEGSHTDRMRSVLARVLGPLRGSPPHGAEEEPDTQDADRERDDGPEPLA
jgi:uncharacterized protein with PIN domain